MHCSIPVALDRAVVYHTLRDNGAMRARLRCRNARPDPFPVTPSLLGRPAAMCDCCGPRRGETAVGLRCSSNGEELPLAGDALERMGSAGLELEP